MNISSILSSTVRSATRKLPAVAGGAALALMTFTGAIAANLNIKDTPLFLSDTPPPLNMLVLSRDHRMYYEAYNDATDLDGDKELDTHFKPTIVYYGYFDSTRCYTHNSAMFVDSGAATLTGSCGGGKWSGNWLNYVTTSRMDALRKVLYGGLRSTDTTTQTVLQRAYIPQDAHSWGKEYSSSDGYDISQYTPYPMPAPNTRHIFANTSPSEGGAPQATGSTNPAANGVPLPLLRVMTNTTLHVWDWVSKERPVASTDMGTINADLIVRVEVCKAGTFVAQVSNCRNYGGNAKPTGLLQDYGENDAMLFGLVSGSYGKPHDGGVLRKAMASLTDEINTSTGQFVYSLDPPGVIGTIDRLRITGFNNYVYDTNGCGWITDSSDADGHCSMWGNPTAEMMYEVVRYFAGKGGGTSDFTSGANNNEETSIGLKVANWDNPYATFPSCSKPFETVISDINPSYDSDKVPGSAFGGFSGDVAGLSASTLGNMIWSNEIGGTGRYFIGQSGADSDGAPTPKTVSSFANIRGLAPEAPAKEGSYNAASVAYFANQNDLSAAAGVQKMQTFAVALASPLPEFKIPVGNATVTLVPFAKSVGGGGYNIDPAGSYQPTNQIVDFYVESKTATSGVFRINFEDVEQGADHDMDAIARYAYTVAGNNLTISVTSEYAAGGIIQHMGYVISGVSPLVDGTYLVVRDVDTDANSDPDYRLDTPPGVSPGGTWSDGTELPLASTRVFTPTSGTSAQFLKDPLWYAAKWGGFKDGNSNGRPDLASEWAANSTSPTPDPDNYFLVTNALTLKDQLARAFAEITSASASAAAAAVSSGSINEQTPTRAYEVKFNSGAWSGELNAYSVLPKVVTAGVVTTEEGTRGPLLWAAHQLIPAPGARRIITVEKTAAGQSSGIYTSGTPFTQSGIGSNRLAELEPASDMLGNDRLEYLRGDRTQEPPLGTTFRARDSRLGDIVNSAPVFVGAPANRYPDSIEPSSAYSGFRGLSGVRDRPGMIYVGANDGMLHAFDEETGVERFAFVPHSVFRNLYKIPSKSYSHQYYVDGTPSVSDAFFGTTWHTVLAGGLNKGGQGIYALDVTRPQNINEASAASTFLWEFTDKADPDLGYTFARPAIVKLRNGSWAAVFGNGYNNTDSQGGADTSVSSTGNAVLFIVDIATGALIRKIDTGMGLANPASGGRPNGLATAAVVDVDGDGVSTIAYAGDLYGNLWKFDLSSTNPGAWGVAYSGTPLFVARDSLGNRQPITDKPAVTRGPYGVGTAVLFGTGKFLEATDRNVVSPKAQTFYGIYDRNTGVPGTDVVAARSNLQVQTIIAEGSGSINGGTYGTRRTSDNAVTAGMQGWYIDLRSPIAGLEGEMQVSDPILRDSRVLFATLIPNSDICSTGGRSWLMEMDAVTGSAPPTPPFFVPNVNGIGTDTIMTSPRVVSGSEADYVLTTNSKGESSTIKRDPGVAGIGRQSWRQLR